MASFIDSGGVRVAFGLAWRVVKNPRNEAAVAAALTKEYEADYRVRWSAQGEIKYGVARIGRAPAKAAVLAAAVLFASKVPHEAHAVLVLPLDAERAKYAIIAVLGGSPHLDVVVPAKNVRERMETLRNEGHGDLIVYGDYPGASGSVPMSLRELVARRSDSAVMERVVQRQRVLTYALTSVALLAYLGYMYGWDNYIKPRFLGNSEQKIDPVAAYRQSLSALLATAGFSGADALKMIWKPLSRQEMFHGGWQAQGAACSASSCSLSWTRISGTNSSFVSVLPAGVSYQIQRDGNNIDTTFATQAAPRRLDESALPRKNEFMLALGSRAQQLQFSTELVGPYGVKHTISEPAAAGLPPAVAASQIPVAMLVSKGGYTISAPLGFVEELLATLPKNMSVEEVSIDVRGGADTASFTVKGSFYVKG
jgi:hypothetical protein